MRNISLDFTTSPWLLLLLIPAIALALWPYFRMSKRFRRTRNRVCSLILHIIILVLCICLLSGLQFHYETSDSQNEIILLVDLSFSSEEDDTVKEQRNEFIRDVLEANHRQCRIGIVTFGYDQVNAAELSYDPVKVFEQYEKAPLPDTSATDIESALRFVWDPRAGEKGAGLFRDADYGKIVLISDGLETDGDAMNVIRDISSKGVRVDTVCFSPRQKYDVEVTGIALPDRDIEVDEEFNVDVTLQTSVTGVANYTLVDEYTDDLGRTVRNNVPAKQVDMSIGTVNISFKHKFLNAGLHKLYLQLESEVDNYTFNNQYYVYKDLTIHDRVLLIERYDEEAQTLDEILNKELQPGENEFVVDTVNLGKPEGDTTKDWIAAPRNLNQLREYDQIILVNIAHSDFELIDSYREQMKQGDEPVSSFELDLYDYVKTEGGGLFTVGGYSRDEYGDVEMDLNQTATPLAHSYVRADMKGTRYQELLPVNIDSYTPPIAVEILIDVSRTMGESSSAGMTKLELAKRAALSCLDAMNTRDYCMISIFGSDHAKVINLTPATKRATLEEAIRIQTVSDENKAFASPIENAARELYYSTTDIEKRHIIMITDGTLPDFQSEDPDRYYSSIRNIYSRYGITMSIAAIGLPDKSSIPAGSLNPYTIYQNMADLSNSYFYYSNDIAQIADYMVEDLRQNAMIGVMSKSFTPQIASRTAAVTGVRQDNLPRMGGFFVTRAKTTGNVQVALTAESVPLYAQWTFGEGRVGSFMCDVGTYFGMNFVESTEGIRIINNIVHDLMPGKDIRANEIELSLIEDNYTTKVSVYTDLTEGQTLEWTVTPKPWTGAENEEAGGAEGVADTNVFEGIILSGGTKRFEFENLDTGIYTITVVKKDAAGVELARCETYRTFSYSGEYDVFRDTQEGIDLLANLAANGDGAVVETVRDIFENFVDLERTFDPRLLFMILALILFLLDVAVRKFKFKWPHELLREHREKKNQAR